MKILLFLVLFLSATFSVAADKNNNPSLSGWYEIVKCEPTCSDLIIDRIYYQTPMNKVKFIKFSVVDRLGSWTTCDSNKPFEFNFRLFDQSRKFIDYVFLNNLKVTEGRFQNVCGGEFQSDSQSAVLKFNTVFASLTRQSEDLFSFVWIDSRLKVDGILTLRKREL